MTTSTPTAPLGNPGAAPAEDRPAREVVVGVDGSEVGLGAVRWAAREAVRRNASLRIVHAAPYLSRGSGGAPPPELSRARRITAQAYTVARHTDHDVQAATEVVPDDPTTVLLRAAAASQLLVLGSSTTGAADELVLASVAVHVGARSPQPVVVVPRQRPGGAEERPVVAVLGVGDRDDDDAVATFAAAAAERSGVGLTVLQTRPPRHSAGPSWVDDLDEWHRRYPGLSVSHSDLPAPRADQILRATCPAPLLAISAGTGGLLHRDLDGPHRWLLRHCTSPMALIPPVHRPEEEPREEIIALG
ncbi:universal stress protein [Blastococcus deserti]|uniref:Universal stress protein n=1 Tax=Blastococcus deserti TaxID=2259033 RepID=A0ABW4X963_9ACTN